MCQVCVVKKFKFWQPRLRGTPTLVLPNFVIFHLTFILTTQFYVYSLKGLKNFNFGGLQFCGNLHSEISNFLGLVYF